MIQPKETYKIRIIYIDHTEHLMFVSLRKHIRMLKKNKPELEFGEVVDEAAVRKIDSFMGCILECPSNVFAFCKRTNASDTPVNRMEKVVELDQVYRCRVIGNSLFDGLLQVTLATSLIESEILSINNLSCDMSLDVTIIKITQKSLLCSIAPHVFIYYI